MHVSEREDINKLYKKALESEENIYNCDNKHLASAIISGINEKYMVSEGDKYISKLNILYFSDFHDIGENMMISGLCGWTDVFTEHKLCLQVGQITMIGLNDIDRDLELEELNELDINYCTISNYRKKKNILDSYDFENTICVFNSDCIQSDTNINGFSFEEIDELCDLMKNKIKYIVTIGNKEKINNFICNKIMNKITLNIFNESSNFLIFRQAKQKSAEDYGWFILRFLNKEERAELLKHIIESENNMITMNIADDEYIDDLLEGEILISYTSIEEQNKKTYFGENYIEDRVLYPQEKTLMMFELINF